MSSTESKDFLKKVIKHWREVERWLAKHNWLRRKLCRVRFTPPKTCEGFGSVKYHPH